MSGDDRFERVAQEYGPSLRRLASAWERDPAASEDLLQEILLALWRALPRFRAEATERTFVYRVAMNRALTHRYRRRPHVEPLEAAVHVADSRQTPEAEATASQQRAQVLGKLQSLPFAMRQILSLSLEGLSRAEIAGILGISENNANVRLSRARRALHEAMNRT